MLEPCPAIVGFATAVVRADLSSEGSARPSDLAQYVTKRLYPRFGMLFGDVGFDALLGRSLALAQRARPFLGEVGAGSGGTLMGLDGKRPRGGIGTLVRLHKPCTVTPPSSEWAQPGKTNHGPCPNDGSARSKGEA